MTEGLTAPRESGGAGRLPRVSARRIAQSVLIAAMVACGGGDRDRDAPGIASRATSDAVGDPAPSSRQSKAPPADLESCPDGDAAWRKALVAARNDGTVDDLRARAEALVAICVGRWQPLWLLGATHGRTAVAGEHYSAALEGARAAGDPIGIASATNGLGQVTKRAGDLAGAEFYVRQSLEAARAAGHIDLERSALNNLAGIKVQQGDLATARTLAEQVARILQETGRTYESLQFDNNLAVLALEMGDATGARDIALQARSRAIVEIEATGSPRYRRLADSLALIAGNVGRILAEPEEAREWYGRVSDHDSELKALAQANGAQIAIAEQRWSEAGELLDEVLEGTEDGITAWLAGIHRAEVDLETGRTERAEARLLELLPGADAAGAGEYTWQARTMLARIRLATGRSAKALTDLRRAVSDLEIAGGDLDPAGSGKRFLRTRAEPYALLATALIADAAAADRAVRASHALESTTADEVLGVIELAHARALRRLLGQPEAEKATISVTALQRGLQDGDLLLDYLVGDTAGVVLAISPDAVRGAVVPGWRDLSTPLHRYRAALRRPLISAEARMAPWRDLSRSLHQGQHLTSMLLTPFAEMIRSARRLHIVPDRELALLPFAALPWEEAQRLEEPVEPTAGAASSSTSIRSVHFLGESVEVDFLPFAGGRERWTSPPAPLLLAGDPLPDDDGVFPRLENSGAELNGVATLWSGDPPDVLRGADLTRARLTELDLAAYRAIHLATHATASTRDPRRCAVILSRGERIGVDEIAQLHLDDSLVVLSACRTGEGEVVPGEGLIGIGWAFLTAGARGLVASLWSVDDTITSTLMVDFQRHRRDGSDPALALALAQRRQIAERKHPAYWAPFVTVLRPTTPGTAR